MQQMSARRFLTTEDVYNDDEQAQPTQIFVAFRRILKSIVSPILAEVYPGMNATGLIKVTAVSDHNDLKFTVMGVWERGRDDSNPGGGVELGRFMKTFEEKRQQITNSVILAVSPTMQDDLLEDNGLSPQQFLVTFQGVSVKPSLLAYNAPNTVPALPMILLRVRVVISLTIEDLSTMEPGGDEMIRLRLASLCSPDSRYPLSELEDWARNLGVTQVEGMTRQELCVAVHKILGL